MARPLGMCRPVRQRVLGRHPAGRPSPRL